MTKPSRKIFTRAEEEDGASLAEYALLLGVITVALVFSIGSFSAAIGGLMNRSTNALQTASSAEASSGQAGAPGNSGSNPGNGGDPPGQGNGKGNGNGNGNGNSGNP